MEAVIVRKKKGMMDFASFFFYVIMNSYVQNSYAEADRFINKRGIA